MLRWMSARTIMKNENICNLEVGPVEDKKREIRLSWDCHVSIMLVKKADRCNGVKK